MKLGMSLLAAGALVMGTAMTASAAVHFENAGFGSDPPVGAQEHNGAAGFSSVWDFNGRTVATAEVVTDNTVNLIDGRLWTNDADLYQVNITDPANFVAVVQGGHTLILFDAAGTALAGVASPGGPAVGRLTSADVPGAGTYYLGMGADGSNPRNAAGQNIFSLSAVPSAPIAGDAVLAADPFVAWELNNLPNGELIGPGNFTRPFDNISVALPEPASLSLLALGGVAMLRRR